MSDLKPGARGLRVASGSWRDPKYWILVNNPLKTAKWCAATNRKERACARRELEIAAQDRGAISGDVLDQQHTLALPML
jgi:hypothetical protein